MIGMILGLAALTSWGLDRFRVLAAAFKPPVGVPVLSDKYNALYGQYLVASAHEVYTAIFLAAGVLCIVAIVPAFFLEGSKPTAYLARSTDNEAYTPGFNRYQRTESEASTANEQREK